MNGGNHSRENIKKNEEEYLESKSVNILYEKVTE